MRRDGERPIGLIIFPIVIIIFNLYYWYPVYMGAWEWIDDIFMPTPFIIFFWINVGLSVIEIAMVTIGFYYRNNWARRYEIGYLSYSSFWAFYSIFFMQWQILEHYGYLILYVVLIIYLLLSDIKNYFTDESEKGSIGKESEKEYYQLGEYILHKRQVKKRGGGTRTFYFFSKGFSEKGTPCKKPKNYLVTYNRRTRVPLLKKLDLMNGDL